MGLPWHNSASEMFVNLIKPCYGFGGEHYYLLTCDWRHTNIIQEHVFVTFLVESLVAHWKYFAMIVVFVLLYLHVLFLYMSVVLVFLYRSRV